MPRAASQKLPLYEEAYLKLKKNIINGRTKPGTRLTEEDVSQQFGISRTPARDALKRLAGEGFVDFTPKRGAVVIGNDREELVTLWEIRAHMEGIAAAKAAIKAKEEDKGRLREVIAKAVDYSARDERQAFAEELRKFDDIILDIANVRQLSRVLSLIVPLISETVLMIYEKGLTNVEERCATHVRICEAICDNTPDLARELTVKHIMEWRDVFVHSYDDLILAR